MSDTIKNLKICAAHQVLDEHKEIYKKANTGALKAAFWKSKLWSSGQKIRIGFLEDPKCGNTYTCGSASQLSDPNQHKQTEANTCASLKQKFPDINTNVDPPFREKVDPLQYQFDKENPKDVKEMVKTIFNERWLPLINLDVKFVEDVKDANIRISFDATLGSWSLVGTDALTKKNGEATINFAWFDVGTVLHEFGHMLGMIHEHQNPRGKQIDWNIPVVEAWTKATQGWNKQQTENNIINPYKINQINGSSFDPNSIMLYFFPACVVKKGYGTHQNLRLSQVDIDWMQKMYPKSTKIDYFNKFYKDAYKSYFKIGFKIALFVFLGLVALALLFYVIYLLRKKFFQANPIIAVPKRSNRGYNR